MENGTLRSLWESYAAAVVPAGASEAQIKATRCAFYGGFASLMLIIHTISGDNVTDRQGVEWLSALDKEIEAFYEESKAGKT